MAYVEAGPSDGPPVLLLHGEPTWSFLYRKVITVLAEAGCRAIAPDLVGFGRSDKPVDTAAHSYARHVAWVRACAFDALDLRGVTVVGQDWGGLIGLRLVAEHPDRFARVVAANTGLPTGDEPMPELWWRFREGGAAITGARRGPVWCSPAAVPSCPPRCSPAMPRRFPTRPSRQGYARCPRSSRPAPTTRRRPPTGRPGANCPHGMPRSWSRSATAIRSLAGWLPCCGAPFPERPGSTTRRSPAPGTSCRRTPVIGWVT